MALGVAARASQHPASTGSLAFNGLGLGFKAKVAFTSIFAAVLGRLGSIVVNIELVVRNLAAMSDPSLTRPYRKNVTLFRGGSRFQRQLPSNLMGNACYRDSNSELPTCRLYIESCSCTGRPANIRVQQNHVWSKLEEISLLR